MPTPGERQALLFVAAVAALGVGVRSWRALRPADADPDAKAALAAQISHVDSAIATGGSRRRVATSESSRAAREMGADSRGGGTRARQPERSGEARPSGAVPVGPVDVDVAAPQELDRLPGIGPALAARIVEDRETRGPFGSLEALQQVRGIGPVLAERLRAHVTFSGPPRPPLTEAPAARRGRHP